MTSEDYSRPTPSLVVARILWAAFVLAVFVYMLLIRMQWVQPAGLDGHVAGLIKWILIAFAVFQLVFQQVYHTFVSQRKMDDAQTPEERAGIFLMGLIVRTACIESIAVFGLVIYILSGDALAAYALGALSVAGFIRIFPTEHQFTGKI